MIPNVVKSIAIDGLSFPDIVVSDGAATPSYRRIRTIAGRLPACTHCGAHLTQQGVLPNQVIRWYIVACDAAGNFTNTPVEGHQACHFSAAPDWPSVIDSIYETALADFLAHQAALKGDTEIPLALAAPTTDVSEVESAANATPSTNV